MLSTTKDAKGRQRTPKDAKSTAKGRQRALPATVERVGWRFYPFPAQEITLNPSIFKLPIALSLVMRVPASAVL